MKHHRNRHPHLHDNDDADDILCDADDMMNYDNVK